jgi:nitrate reductase gamma subunit
MPTATIVAASVGTTLSIVLVVGVIMLYIRRRPTNRHEEGIEMQLTGNSAPPS